MGHHFYTQQLQATGTCPGINPNKRRKRMAWTDEAKQQAIDAYEAENPTPETSIEIVKQIAEDMSESVNGVRMILAKAGVYIKKVAGATPSAPSDTAKPARVSKEDAQNTLKAAITAAGQEVDEDIITKLTGKAAIYLAAVISASGATEAE